MSIYRQIDSNRRATWLLMVLFVLFVSAVVEVFALAMGLGHEAAVITMVIGVLLSFFSYYGSSSLILGISQARKISKDDSPDLYNLVENLCIGSGLPVPNIYIIDDTAPNAFATGRDPMHASIAVTTGLLQKLDKMELEGVIAHELSHVKNYDIRLMSIIVVLVGLIALLSDLFLRYTWFSGGARRRSSHDKRGGGAEAIIFIIAIIMAILAPVAAKIIQLAISRQREYLADSSGSLLTRYPEGLASALEKISRDKEPLEVANKATAHLYIVNPLKDRQNWMNSLFSTHPPIEERIKKLRSM